MQPNWERLDVDLPWPQLWERQDTGAGEDVRRATMSGPLQSMKIVDGGKGSCSALSPSIRSAAQRHGPSMKLRTGDPSPASQRPAAAGPDEIELGAVGAGANSMKVPPRREQTPAMVARGGVARPQLHATM